MLSLFGVGVKPYYEYAGITIYHGDCREILPELNGVDVVLTDPPYGLQGARGGNRSRGKAKYTANGWDDTPEYIADVCVPVISRCLEMADKVVVTPGVKHMFMYPQPDDVGCFWTPASTGVSTWGLTTYHPVFYYGRDPRAGKGTWPNGKEVTEPSNVDGHPCAKPLNAWQWLLAKASMEQDDVILDPFMGSGTTLRAAKNMGRHAIGIEIEERYCELAGERLRQEVMPMGLE